MYLGQPLPQFSRTSRTIATGFRQATLPNATDGPNSGVADSLDEVKAAFRVAGGTRAGRTLMKRSEYLDLRGRFEPEPVRLVIIAESPRHAQMV